MICKMKFVFTCLIFFLFPIMSLVDITDSLYMNLSLADIFILPLGLVWLFDIRRFSIKKHFPYVWYFLLYIIVLLVSNVYNMYSPVESTGISGMLAEIVKITTNALYFFVAYNAINKEGAGTRKVFFSWIAGLYLFILYGLYAQISQMLDIIPWTFNHTIINHKRFLGTLTDPNAAALYLSISFFIVLIGIEYLFISNRYRIWLYVTNAFVLICMILTQSRGGMIGFICALVLWILLNIKCFIRYTHMALLAICLFLSIFVIDTAYFSNKILLHFYQRIEDIDTSLESGALHTRYHLSMAAMRIGIANPVIGIGRGNFPLNSEPYLIEQGADMEIRAGTFRNAIPHNTLAGVFSETGFIGLLSFLSLYIIMSIKIKRQNNFDKDVKIIILALWIGVLVQSMAISLENARVLWLTMGLLFCFADKKIMFIQNNKEKNAVFSSIKLKIAVATISILLCITMYFYVSLRFSYGVIDISSTTLTLSYQAQENGIYTLRYWVDTIPNENEGEQMRVFIRKSKTGEIMNHEIYATRSYGYANLLFEANKVESFTIEFTGSDLSTVWDVKIIPPSDDIRAIAGNYPLLPRWLYLYAQSNGYLISRTEDTLKINEH